MAYQQYPQQQPQPQRGMQQYYRPQYTPQPQAPPQGTHKHTLLVAMAVLLVVVLVALVFVYVNVDGTEQGTTEEVTYPYSTGELSPDELVEPEFKINNFKFASLVDDNLNYQETPATFNRGDKFWVYFEINNLASGDMRGKYRTSYDEYIAVNDPNGNPVTDLTGFLGTTTENAEEGKFYSFPVAHQLPTSVDYVPGKYDLTIFIDDAINEESAAISASFILK